MRAVTRTARAASPRAGTRPRSLAPTGQPHPIASQHRRVYYHFRATRPLSEAKVDYSESQPVPGVKVWAAKQDQDAPEKATKDAEGGDTPASAPEPAAAEEPKAAAEEPPAAAEEPKAAAEEPPAAAEEPKAAAEEPKAAAEEPVKDKVVEEVAATPAVEEVAASVASGSSAEVPPEISPLRLKELAAVELKEGEMSPAALVSYNRSEYLAAASSGFQAAVQPLSKQADELAALVVDKGAPEAVAPQKAEGTDYVVDRAGLGVSTSELDNLTASLGAGATEGPMLKAVRECNEKGRGVWSEAKSKAGGSALQSLDAEDPLAKQINSFAGYYRELTSSASIEISSLKHSVLSENEYDIIKAHREVQFLHDERREALIELEDLDRAWDLSHELDNHYWNVCLAYLNRIGKLEDAAAREANKDLSKDADQVLQATQEVDQKWVGVKDSLAKDSRQLVHARAAADAEAKGALEEAAAEHEALVGQLRTIESEQNTVLEEIKKLQAKLGDLGQQHSDVVSNLDRLQLHRQRIVDQKARFNQATDEHEVALAGISGKIDTLRDGIGQVADMVKSQDQMRTLVQSGNSVRINEVVVQQAMEYWRSYCEFYYMCSELISASEYEAQENEGKIAKLQKELSDESGEGAKKRVIEWQLQQLEAAQTRIQSNIEEMKGQLTLQHASEEVRQQHARLRSMLSETGHLPGMHLVDPEVQTRKGMHKLKEERVAFAEAKVPHQEHIDSFVAAKESAARFSREEGDEESELSLQPGKDLEFVDPRPKNGGVVIFWVNEDGQVQYSKNGVARPAFTTLEVKQTFRIAGKASYYLVFPQLQGKGYEGRVLLPAGRGQRTVILWTLKSIMEKAKLQVPPSLEKQCMAHQRLSERVMKSTNLTELAAVIEADESAGTDPIETEVAPAKAKVSVTVSSNTRVTFAGAVVYSLTAAALASSANPVAILAGIPAGAVTTTQAYSAAAAGFAIAPISAVLCKVEKASGFGQFLRLAIAGGLTAAAVPFLSVPGDGLFELATEDRGFPDKARVVEHASSVLRQHGHLIVGAGAASSALVGVLALFVPGTTLVVLGTVGGGFAVYTTSPPEVQQSLRQQTRAQGPIGACSGLLEECLRRSRAA